MAVLCIEPGSLPPSSASPIISRHATHSHTVSYSKAFLEAQSLILSVQETRKAPGQEVMFCKGNIPCA